jgi:hypothetical protein
MKVQIVAYSILILGISQIGFSQKNYIGNSDSKCLQFKGYINNVPIFVDSDNGGLYTLTYQNGNNIFKFEFKSEIEFSNTSLMWISNEIMISRYKENNLIINYKGFVDTIICNRQRIEYIDGQQFSQYKNTDTIFALLGDSDFDGNFSKPAFLNICIRNKGFYEIEELPIRALNFTIIDEMIYYLTEENDVYKLYSVKVGNWQHSKLILDNAILKGWFVVEDKFILTLSEFDRKYYYILVNLNNLEIDKIREKPIDEEPISTPPIYLNKKYYIFKSGYTDFSLKNCKPYLLEFKVK